MRLFTVLRLVRFLTSAALVSVILMLAHNEYFPRNIFTFMVPSREGGMALLQRRASLESLPAPVNVTLPTTPIPAIASVIKTFSSFRDETLFLYQKYVLSNWRHRPERVRSLRRDIFHSSSWTTIDQFVLTRQNTNSTTLMPFYAKYLGKNAPLYKPQPDLIKILPKTPILPKGTIFNKCSVVGNGGILLRSACGKEIDSADYVLRCNLVPIKNFGIDAGFKTNLTTMNPSILRTRYHDLRIPTDSRRFMKDLQEYSGHLFIPCMHNGGLLKFCMTKLLPAILEAQKTRSTTKLTVGNPRHLLGIMNMWKPSGINYMSTGFYLAQTALTMCNEVHLFGFWAFNKSFYPIPRTFKYHFFDEMKQSKVHKFNTEFQILWQQHAEGVLKIHAQDCEDPDY